MRLTTKRRLLFLVLALATIACTTLNVQNRSDHKIRVQVSMPDGEGPVIKSVPAHDEMDFFSETGGVFNVAVMPSEEYIADMRERAETITLYLFATNAFAGKDDISKMIDDMSKLHDEIHELMTNYERCQKNVKQDEIGVAIVTWERDETDKPQVTCNTN